MACDYRAIRRENTRRYGTEVREYGGKLLPHRYGDRTHFIYELLQNAEDALARRDNWTGARSVLFHLFPGELRFAHCGQPFDEADVRSICGIGESTKDPGLTDIGRFGIGFKSVHAFTERPRVHSGAEDFAIENFVLPAAAPRLASRGADETVFAFPLRSPDDGTVIRQAVRRLAPRALLFLRQIEIIEWKVDRGPSGLYLREEERLDGRARRVTLSGEADRQRETEQTWLVFARPVPGATPAKRQVEVAFRLRGGRVEPAPEADTPLFAFFPTTLRTGLPFRVQGPFRTTLARDNLPAGDPWNASLMAGVSTLLHEALLWLRDHDLLDLPAFDCLPLSRERFPDGSLFAPLRRASVAALRSEPLLPCFGGGRVAGENACLASPGWLRELFDRNQLAALFGGGEGAGWLSEEVSPARTRELCQVLLGEAGVRTVRPDAVLSRLDADFLEAQDDDWLRRFYETLAEHGGTRARVRRVPLIRLSDGSHVRPDDGESPAAFLPGPTPSDLPMVRASVCDSPAARKFLRGLGLTPPDPVDQVLRTVVPAYRSRARDPEAPDCAADLRALALAHASGSRMARRRLENELRTLRFVPSVGLRTGGATFSTPEESCFATGPQRELFSGIPRIRIVDDSHDALLDDAARALLRTAGVRRLLEPVREEAPLSEEEQQGIRAELPAVPAEAGLTRIEDWTLVGLDALLPAVARMRASERSRRASMLAGELAGVPELDDLAVRSGKYEWAPPGGAPRTVSIPAAWMRRLNRSAWAPDARPVLSIGPPETGGDPKKGDLEPAAARLLGRRGIRTVGAVRELLSRSAFPASGVGSPAGRVPPARSRDPVVEVRPDSGEGSESGNPERRRRLLEVENEAVRVIQSREPEWIRAPQENPGFDLFRRDERGATVLWCEVKAIRGTLDNHPAMLTATQARFALERRGSYWLYIVENVGGDDPRIVRIQDPVGQAGRLAFGPEWRELSQPPPSRE